MTKRTEDLRRTKGWVGAGIVLSNLLLLVACGGGPAGRSTYDAGRSAVALIAAGWQARLTSGMPQTYAGVHQIGFIEGRAPDGTQVDLQFLDDAASAGKEQRAIQAHQPSFTGGTIQNVLIDPVGTMAISAADRADLRAHLRR